MLHTRVHSFFATFKNKKNVNEVLRINKKRFATGLFWQPVAVGFTPRKYAHHLTHNSSIRSKLFIEYHSMIGLGEKNKGYIIGMPSAAAEIVDTLSEYSSFLAAFYIDKKYYLVAVRNGIILSDKLFNDESTARAEYAKFLKIPDWTMCIAPNNWAIPRAIDKDLISLLSHKTKYKLRAINLWRERIFSLILMCIFLMCVYILFHEPIHKIRNVNKININPELAAEYQRKIDEKNKELDIQFDITREQEQKALVIPYSNLPVPSARAKQCYQAIGFLMQPITGWNQSNIICDERTATAEFNRKFGSLDDFYRLAADFLPGAEITELNDNTLSVSVNLPNIEHHASQDERDAETIERNVTSLFQNMKIEAKTEIVVDSLTNGVETANLNIVEIAVSAKLSPMQFTKMFENFGGFYITRCMWNAIARTWNYEVIIYAK